MTTVHIVGNHAPAKSATGSADGTDPATGDAFAALMAALLPQAASGDAVLAATTGTTTPTDGATAIPGAATADASAAGPAVLNLTDMPDAALHGLETAAAAITGHGPIDGADGGTDVKVDGKVDGKIDGHGLDGKHASLDLTSVAPATTTTVDPAATTGESTALNPALLGRAAGSDTERAAETEAETEDAVTATTGTATAATAGTKKTATPIAIETDDTVDGAEAHPVAEPLHQPVVHAAENPHAETAPVAAPQPHQQLAAVIAPLRRGADGEYKLSLRLRPEHLGTVDLDVQVHMGTVEIHVHTEHEEARHLLVAHLDDLRRELEQAGLRTGNLDVSDRGQNRQAHANQGHGQRSPVNPDPAAAGPATPTVTNRPATVAADGAVDVQL